MRKIMLFCVMAASLAVAACNTVAGAGKDTSNLGHDVTKAAEQNK